MNQQYLADQIIRERLREAADWRRAADATRGRRPSRLAGIVHRFLVPVLAQPAPAPTVTTERPGSTA